MCTVVVIKALKLVCAHLAQQRQEVYRRFSEVDANYKLVRWHWLEIHHCQCLAQYVRAVNPVDKEFILTLIFDRLQLHVQNVNVLRGHFENESTILDVLPVCGRSIEVLVSALDADFEQRKVLKAELASIHRLFHSALKLWKMFAGYGSAAGWEPLCSFYQVTLLAGIQCSSRISSSSLLNGFAPAQRIALPNGTWEQTPMQASDCIDIDGIFLHHREHIRIDEDARFRNEPVLYVSLPCYRGNLYSYFDIFQCQVTDSASQIHWRCAECVTRRCMCRQANHSAFINNLR